MKKNNLKENLTKKTTMTNDNKEEKKSKQKTIEKLSKQTKEKNNIKKENIDNYKYEHELKEKGIKLIAGVDEVGRGPLIGPVVAAAVILPDNFQLDGLTDSKKLSEKKREQYYEIIKEKALSIGVGIISEKRIDEINIYEATKEAMKQAIDNLTIKPEHILIDAMPLDLEIEQHQLLKETY